VPDTAKVNKLVTVLFFLPACGSQAGLLHLRQIQKAHAAISDLASLRQGHGIPSLSDWRNQAGLQRDNYSAKVPGLCPVLRQVTPANFVAGPLAGMFGITCTSALTY
jgi:hypothetical protein